MVMWGVGSNSFVSCQSGYDSFALIDIIPCNAASRPTVIDKDQPIKSLGSMNRDKIFKAFDIYIRECSVANFGSRSDLV